VLFDIWTCLEITSAWNNIRSLACSVSRYFPSGVRGGSRKICLLIYNMLFRNTFRYVLMLSGSSYWSLDLIRLDLLVYCLLHFIPFTAFLSLIFFPNNPGGCLASLYLNPLNTVPYAARASKGRITGPAVPVFRWRPEAQLTQNAAW